MEGVTGQWHFDTVVASRFDEIARTNIPHYEEVIQKCLQVARKSFPDREHAKIIDVGSATGHTMETFIADGYKNVFGVDNAQAMIESCRVRKNLIQSETFPGDYGLFDMVLANWTLHFITESAKRRRYLQDIYDSLSEGGALIVSDKIVSTPYALERYHDFKRSMGLTEEQIATKAEAIKGILVPFPLGWYFETLKEVGFKNIELIDASWCFATLLCWK